MERHARARGWHGLGVVGLMILGCGGGADAGSAGTANTAAAAGAPAGGAAGAAGSERGGNAGAAGQPTTLPACEAPDSQLLPTIHSGAELTFSTQSGLPIQVGTATNPSATDPDEWLDAASLVLPASGTIKVFARVQQPSCESTRFEHAYAVRAAYPGPLADSSSTAIALDDAAILGWATGYEDLVLGANSTNPQLQDPALVLGPAAQSSYDVVALGDGGEITLVFDPPIANGAGWDFAVFENSFNDTFLELAYVEVSSDGTTFVRFDSAYLGTDPVGGFGAHSTTLFEGLAGKYPQGHGNPFDLDMLRYRPEVQSGAVDLTHISRVRIVDIVGDGSATDSFGNTIYDPHPTAQSAGFDLDAIAVLHAAG